MLETSLEAEKKKGLDVVVLVCMGVYTHLFVYTFLICI